MLLLLLSAGGGAFLWQRGGRQTEDVAEAPQGEALSQGVFRLSDAEMRALRIEELQPREFRAERVAEGRIAYNEDRSTPVFSPYNGRVTRVTARLGDEISVGEALLEMETTDLAGAA
ncbi:MAG: efflux RND transporter periplasmic adaptor subunit, partial [Acetobacteraceae bacterium]|nr:efflux RND transporter periplasmic adaptor subunit [Acetobacteraceae bacterium]